MACGEVAAGARRQRRKKTHTHTHTQRRNNMAPSMRKVAVTKAVAAWAVLLVCVAGVASASVASAGAGAGVGAGAGAGGDYHGQVEGAAATTLTHGPLTPFTHMPEVTRAPTVTGGASTRAAAAPAFGNVRGASSPAASGRGGRGGGGGVAACSGACASLNMTVCKTRCSGGCVSYTTPVGRCWSPAKRYPHNPQWGTTDILDVCLDGGRQVNRSFFASTNGTCMHHTGGFLLPTAACIGPFGPPRPWGTFVCIPPAAAGR